VPPASARAASWRASHLASSGPPPRQGSHDGPLHRSGEEPGVILLRGPDGDGPLPVRAVRRAGDLRARTSSFAPGLQVTASFADVTCGAPKSLRMQGVLNHAVKGRMPNNEDQLPPRPLALAVVRKAIEESRGRAAHTAEGSCLLCGSPTVETYSSLPWGTQVRLLVCADGHCGAVAAVPTRPLGVPPTLGPGTKSR
jgi:hypothetical protein